MKTNTIFALLLTITFSLKITAASGRRQAAAIMQQIFMLAKKSAQNKIAGTELSWQTFKLINPALAAKFSYICRPKETVAETGEDKN